MPVYSDIDRPSTWRLYRAGMCDSCQSHCCTLPVEVDADDLVRMGYLDPDMALSPKKAARALAKVGIVHSYRARTGLFTLVQKPTGECRFLGSDRRCTIYEKRPRVCRSFPAIGPRPGYCPSRRKPAMTATSMTARGPARGQASPTTTFA